MLEIKEVPYRVWNRRGQLVDASEGKRVMALMGKEMKAGKAVEFTQHPPVNPTFMPSAYLATPGEYIYDTISLTVTE